MQWFNCNFNVLADEGVMVAWSRFVCRQFHCHRTGLHQPIGGRFIWQRRHCHLCAAVHLLFVGEIGENGIGVLGCNGCTLLLLHGLRVGRICFHYQLDSVARIRFATHGTLFASSVHQLHHLLHFGLVILDANSICRFPTDSYQRAYGRVRRFCIDFGCGIFEAFANHSLETRIQETLHHWRIGCSSTCLWRCRSLDSLRRKCFSC